VPEVLPPHAADQRVTAGPAPGEANAALILVHGRGGSAREMLLLAREIADGTVACMAPQASGHTWYPYSFLSPLEENEPGLSSGLAVLDALVREAIEAGVPRERVALLGFSQGACLALEFVARFAERFGGVIGLSGGLIGPPNTPRNYVGSLQGTPVLLGCSDVDPHIPLERVEETATVLADLGGEVTKRIYPGLGHTINSDELDRARAVLERIVSTA
jgi:predicted esterase